MSSPQLSRRQILFGLVGLAECPRLLERLPALPPSEAAVRAGLASASAKGILSSAARIDALKAIREQLRPLHQRPSSAKAGEWLAEHDEPGQTFEQYVASNPVTLDAVRKVLVVQPLGEFSDAQRKILGLAVDYMGRFFNVETRTMPDIAASMVPARARRTHPSSGDKQIQTTFVLEELLKPRLPRDAVASIAFTATDLWPGDGWNFVYGQADLEDRVGVWSMYRNGDPTSSSDAFERVLLRTLRTAVHETGHMFSLRHCAAYRCVQAGVNNQEEEDRAPLWLCPECVIKVAWATNADVRKRYGRLAAFCKEQRLETEATFFDRSIAALGQRAQRIPAEP